MAILAGLRRKLSSDGEAELRCALCGWRFRREPPNCPACGSSTFVERGP